MYRPSRRLAFTLIEVLVATVVTAIIVVGARGLYDALTAHLAQVRNVTSAADASGNGERLIRQLVRNVEVHLEPDSAFIGDPYGTTFISSCQAGWGWLERQRATVSVVDSNYWSLVVVRCPRESRLVVMRVPSPAALRYLTSEAEGSGWVESWAAGQMPPRAIAIKTARDTIILPLGVRW